MENIYFIDHKWIKVSLSKAYRFIFDDSLPDYSPKIVTLPHYILCVINL